MEYYWGYAAANTPLPNIYNRTSTSSSAGNNNSIGHSNAPSSSRPTPTRSNSTKAVSTTSRRSRIPGHRRTTSSDSVRSSRPSHDISPLHLDLSLRPHQSAPPAPPPASPATKVFSGYSSAYSAAGAGYYPSTLHAGGGTAVVATAAAADSSGPTAASGDVAAREQHQQTQQQQQRMPASVRYQNKQLPATPRLDTHDASTRHNALARTSSAASSAVSPASGTVGLGQPGGPPTPASPAFTSSNSHRIAAASAADRRSVHHATMPPDSAVLRTSGLPFGRTDSVSSTSGTTVSSRTMLSSDPPLTADGGSAAGGPPGSSSTAAQQQQTKPFIVRNGRTYLSDPTLPYPLPVDLNELNRQSIRTLLLFQLFGGPICSPAFANKPPQRVLEVGCGSGFWSMMCHRYYARHGHSNISFTGIDMACIGSVSGSSTSASSSTSSPSTEGRPDKDMKWRLVQHDMRVTPWPFEKDEFDLVMVKDLSLATPTALQQALMDEYLRILRPGGTLEIWESDHTLRMLRPHVPEHSAHHCATDDEEEHEAAASLGAYLMTAHTPLSAPLNNFLVEYNGWMARALEQRSLSPVPCTLIGPMLLQEADGLQNVGSRRVAVPLSEIKWEREGVGGVITKNDGKSYIATDKAGKKGGERVPEPSRKMLTAGQVALRRTALLTVVQLIQNLEPLLREVSGKSQDEWDGWAGKMMNDLMKENGTSWGECLEVGAWWARKRKS